MRSADVIEQNTSTAQRSTWGATALQWQTPNNPARLYKHTPQHMQEDNEYKITLQYYESRSVEPERRGRDSKGK